MTPEQADETRAAHGVLIALIFVVPFYAVLGIIGYIVWRMVT